MNAALTMLPTTFPSPDRGVWEIGPLSIRAYALCILAGIAVAMWWSSRRWVARGGERGTIVDIAIWAVPFGLIGGRLYHVITDYYRYFGPGKNPVDALKIWEGGLGIWGAIALGGVGAWIACRRKGIPLPAIADTVAPGILVAQAIGRIGNYFNQELYGGSTDLPWGMEVYQRVDPGTGLADPLNGVAQNSIPLDVSPVHPTFLYELLWNLGVAALVVAAERRYRLGHGRAFALYVAGYTAGRFWIELLRDDPATIVFGLRVNVWVAALVFIGAVVYMVLARARGEREDIAALTAARAEQPADTEAHTDTTADPAADTKADSDTADSDTADSDTNADSDTDGMDTDPEKATDGTDTENASQPASEKSDT